MTKLLKMEKLLTRFISQLPIQSLLGPQVGPKLILKDSGRLINSKNYKQKNTWISLVTKKLNYSYDQRSKIEFNGLVNIKDINVDLNWVYGIRCTDVITSFCYYKSEENPIDECLIYFSACVVIVYYYKLNEQRHYINHESDICSIAVSKTGLVASGDTGKKSSVHIWDLKTLKNKVVFKAYHKHDVYLLNFTNNDKFLVVCGKRLITPVIIYDIEQETVVLSTHVDQFVRQIITVHNLIGSFSYGMEDEENSSLVEKHFILLSSEKIFFFESNKYGIYRNKVHNLNELEEEFDMITCGCSFFMNKSNPQLRAYAGNPD